MAANATPDPAVAVDITAMQTLLEQISASYASANLPLGVPIFADHPYQQHPVGLNLATLNRHGLIAGATGTGKTRTVQLLAERLSAAGVPSLVTDVKGDLTGLAQPGAPSEKLLARTQALGQDFQPQAFPCEFYSVGGAAKAVPMRTTITDYGPLLLARALELNQTQTQALELIFHWADQRGLELYDLNDLKATINFLTGAGRDELKQIGGISTATAGVILRAVATLQIQDGDYFFGQPPFETEDLLRLSADGRGVISVLELPQMLSRPTLISAFIMWILADLFTDLPEVGDVEKPRLVLFFDEAHLLFDGASTEFLRHVIQIVKLIRSKGVGIVFITQAPTDIPDEVLGQLAFRVQHALRAHTPREAKALQATVDTFPRTEFDLRETITSLGTGEAILSGLDAKGRPTAVSPTRLFAPEAVMGPASEQIVQTVIANSPLGSKYREAFNADSAEEKLRDGRLDPRVPQQTQPVPQEQAPQAPAPQAPAPQAPAPQAPLPPEPYPTSGQGYGYSAPDGSSGGIADSMGGALGGAFESFARSLGTQLGREISRTVFGTPTRRRRTNRSSSRRSTRNNGWW